MPTKKRVLISILLLITMIIECFPFSAYAEEYFNYRGKEMGAIKPIAQLILTYNGVSEYSYTDIDIGDNTTPVFTVKKGETINISHDCKLL